MGREWFGEIQLIPGFPHGGVGEGNLEFSDQNQKKTGENP